MRYTGLHEIALEQTLHAKAAGAYIPPQHLFVAGHDAHRRAVAFARFNVVDADAISPPPLECVTPPCTQAKYRASRMPDAGQSGKFTTPPIACIDIEEYAASHAILHVASPSNLHRCIT